MFTRVHLRTSGSPRGTRSSSGPPRGGGRRGTDGTRAALGRLPEMIDQDVLTRVLGTAVKSGADFAEVFAEDKRSTSAGLDDGRIEQVTSGRDRGAGIR
eukprot:gene21539-41618_t